MPSPARSQAPCPSGHSLLEERSRNQGELSTSSLLLCPSAQAFVGKPALGHQVAGAGVMFASTEKHQSPVPCWSGRRCPAPDGLGMRELPMGFQLPPVLSACPGWMRLPLGWRRALPGLSSRAGLPVPASGLPQEGLQDSGLGGPRAQHIVKCLLGSSLLLVPGLGWCLELADIFIHQDISPPYFGI